MYFPEIRHEDLCHPESRRGPFTADGWLFELKHDGFRVLAVRMEAGIRLLSRSRRSLSEAFPEIPHDLACQTCSLVLDGELVVPDAEGRSDFGELRRRSLLQQRRRIEQARLSRPRRSSSSTSCTPMARTCGRCRSLGVGSASYSRREALKWHDRR